MNINNKTQLQQDLESIQNKIDASEDAIAIAIDRLNDARKYFWGLPDERLSGVLQHLNDSDELNSLFISHSGYAVDLNSLAENHTDIVKRAAIGRSRDYTITDGVVELEVLPEDQPIDDVLDSPEV